MAHFNNVLKRNVVLIMDNPPIHKTKRFKKDIGVITVYLSSYSPDINPFKNFFSDFKTRVNQKNQKPGKRKILSNYVIESL